jgi:hypothetical protein
LKGDAPGLNHVSKVDANLPYLQEGTGEKEKEKEKEEGEGQESRFLSNRDPK